MASSTVRALVLPGARAALVARPQAAAAGAARQSLDPPPGRGVRTPVFLRGHLFRAVHLWGLACIASAQLAIADPAAAAPRTCEVPSAQEAAAQGDRLFEKGEYQHAGLCYQAAGDMVHANLAFLKAAAPQSEDTTRALKAQREAAKALFARVGNSLRSGH